MGNTLARTKILGIIRDSPHPTTYSYIKKIMGNSCSRVTIYRVLLRLEDDNQIHRFPDLNGDFRYAARETADGTSQELSYFQCLQCNTLFSFKTENLKAKVPDCYTTTSISFLASGICPDCAVKKSKLVSSHVLFKN